MNPISYLKSTLSELKLVQWPSLPKTINLTGIVIAISIFVGIYVGLLDFSFTNLMSILFRT